MQLQHLSPLRSGTMGRGTGSRAALVLIFLILSLASSFGSGAESDASLLRIAGSSTVFPLVSAWAERLLSNYSFTDHTGFSTVCGSANSTLCSGGSSEGARRLCMDRDDPSHVDIGTMSRAWTDEEAQILDDGYTYECLSTQQRFTQLTAGVDGVVVAFSTSGVAANCLLALGGLTLAQLRWIFSDWSEDTLANDANGQLDIDSVTPNNNYNGIREWSDLSDECPIQPINTYGHDSDSGTRNFFGEVVFCEECFDGASGYTAEGFSDCDSTVLESLQSLSSSAEIEEFLTSDRPANCYLSGRSDEEILQWVMADSLGVAITGFAFYAGETESLDAIRIASDTVYGVQDTTDALIEPSSYSIVDGSYSVFTRTLYLNVDNEVWSLVRPYLSFAYSDVGLEIVNDVGYVAVNTALRAKLLQRIDQGANPAADYIPVAPEECPVGTELITSEYFNAYGTAKTSYQCLPCQPGYVKANTNPISCTACSAGSMVAEEGQSKCETCEAGSYSLQGSANCTLCPVNSFAEKPGASECTLCDEGFIVDTEGATACDRCAKGTYRSINDTQCIACPNQMTTAFLAATQLSDCACAEGLYLAEGGLAEEGPCEVCPDGLECPFGSAFEHFAMLDEDPSLTIPLVEVGLWTSLSDPLNVFECHDDTGGDICPGGLPQQCSGGRIGIGCAVCPEGQQWVNRICQDCQPVAATLLVMAPFGLAFAVVFAYYFANSPLSSNLTVATAATTVFSQLLTVAQTLSMFGDLSITWPGKVEGLFTALRFTVGSPDIGLECALSSEATALYGFRCSIPAIVVLELSLCFFASKVFLWFGKYTDVDAAASSETSSLPMLEVDPTLSEAQHVEALAAQVDIRSTHSAGQQPANPARASAQSQTSALMAAQASAYGAQSHARASPAPLSTSPYPSTGLSPSPSVSQRPALPLAPTHSATSSNRGKLAAAATATPSATTTGTATAAATISATFSSHSKRWKPWTIDTTLNTMGQMLQGLFIAVAAIVVVPFQCYSHPNGMLSLIKYPEVFCYEPGSHAVLICMSAAVAIFFVIPFIVWCLFGTWAVVNYQTGANLRLRVRYRFLLFRFRPDKWWWGGLFLFRQLALAFAPSLPNDSPHGQALYVIIVLMIYGFLEAHYWPWKVPELNLLDMGTTCGLIVVITGAMALVPRTESLDFFEWLLLCTLMLLAFGYVCIAALVVRSFLRDARTIITNGTSPGRVSFGVDRGAFREDAEVRLFEAVTSLIEAGPENFQETLLQMSRYDQMLVIKAFDAYVASKLPVQVGHMYRPQSRVLGLVRSDIDEISVIRRSRRSMTSQTSGSLAARMSVGSSGFFADVERRSTDEDSQRQQQQQGCEEQQEPQEPQEQLQQDEQDEQGLEAAGLSLESQGTVLGTGMGSAEMPLKSANKGHPLMQVYNVSDLKLNFEAGGEVDLDVFAGEGGAAVLENELEMGLGNDDETLERDVSSSAPSTSYFDRVYPKDRSPPTPGATSSEVGDTVFLHRPPKLFDL